jgi:Fe-S-cluster containining protein
MKEIGFKPTDTLAGQIKRLPPEGLKMVNQMLMFYWKQFRRMRKLSGVIVMPPMFAATTRVLAAEKAQDPMSKDITCKPGCNHCCKHVVDITTVEAQAIVHYARERGVPIDRDHLARQAGHHAATWNELGPKYRECAFLRADGLCSIYEVRPLPCRKLFVVTDPELCDSIKHPGGQVGRWNSIEVEALTTVAMTVWPTGPLPAMILEVLDAQGKKR